MPQKGFVVQLSDAQAAELRQILGLPEDGEVTAEIFSKALRKLAERAGVDFGIVDARPEVKASLDGPDGGKHPLVADAERRAKAAAQ